MKMGQGRVSALMVVLIILITHNTVELSHAATFTVGDRKGWSFNIASWPKGKTFRAGDILVFKYGQGAHNVVTNNVSGYNKCTTPRGAKVYTSGNDRIRLVKGRNHFTCNYPGHCESAMKIAVTAI